MVGIVHEFDVMMMSGAGGTGQVPQIAVTLRIVDAATGQIVWAGNASRTGKDRETVFGMGRVDSLNTLAEMTAQELARAFAQSLGK
jgi:curli biogenesis system outer membrane secretion channel CsgG